MFPTPTDPETGLAQLWGVMHGEKGDLVTRSQEYGRWTIPAVCPHDNAEGVEQEKGDVASGPRLVNHLANKVVDTMFPHDRPFFTITLTPDVRKKLREEMGKDAEAGFADAVREETASVEETAVRKLNLTSYRPRAVEAVKHLIITGNCLIRRLKSGKRIVYGVKDFCIRRDLEGEPIEIILMDRKFFSGLDATLKQRALQVNPDYKETDTVDLYTHYKWDGHRWAMKQAVDEIDIDHGTRYKPVDLPVLSLVWNLSRGDNYGRGHVEDHATAFHQIDVYSRAIQDMAAIMADVKYLVDPGSVLDVAELNASPRGSYHQGRKDDISTPEGARRLEIEALRVLVAALERELAQAFLLNSSATRDAERVTAEEIRFIAMELESAFGGLYSRLALEWQQREAEYAVSQINFSTETTGNLSTFEVIVTTGLETLSREGQLDNVRRAIADLQLMDMVPEELRGTINPSKFASFVFTNHAVKFKEFSYTPDEIAKNNQAAQQQEQASMNAQANANVQEQAGKAAFTGE